jgi:tRNA A37 threonylcarbamoyladenosine synthetase subunit TsaC/SUA5/YrdC
LLVEELSGPLLTTSVKDEDEIIGYTTDPDQIFEKFSEEVDLIIDAGPGKNTPSTVVDVSSGEFRLVRQGLGNFDDLI